MNCRRTAVLGQHRKKGTVNYILLSCFMIYKLSCGCTLVTLCATAVTRQPTAVTRQPTYITNKRVWIHTFYFCGALTRFRVMAYPSGASRSHSLDTPQSVGLLWASDLPDAQTSTWQHTALTKDKHPWPRRDSNSQSQQASGPRPTPQTARPLGSATNSQ